MTSAWWGPALTTTKRSLRPWLNVAWAERQSCSGFMLPRPSPGIRAIAMEAPLRIVVGLLPGQTSDLRPPGIPAVHRQATQQVIEGPILEHHDHEVVDV